MNDADRQRLRTQLLQLKREIVNEGDETIEPNRADLTSRTDEDAQPLNEMNQVIASRRNRVRAGSLQQIEGALARLAEQPEDFGLCLECEEEIPLRRLELMPYAEYCVQCQAKHDEARGGRRSNLRDFVK